MNCSSVDSRLQTLPNCALTEVTSQASQHRSLTKLRIVATAVVLRCDQRLNLELPNVRYVKDAQLRQISDGIIAETPSASASYSVDASVHMHYLPGSHRE